MDKQIIFDYIEQSGGAEIPALQSRFGLPYRQAKSIVDELVKDNRLEYGGGVRYLRARTKDSGVFVTPQGKEKSPDEFVNRLLLEQCKKVCDRIKRNASESESSDDVNADGEILQWLSKKLQSYKTFRLYDAMRKAEDELLLARLECSGYNVDSCTRIWNFFINCSEVEFEKLKKRITDNNG